MKAKWIPGTLGLLLVASLAGNAWLGATLRAYRYNVSQGWFAYSRDGAPEFPISGLPATELKRLLDQIDATEQPNVEDKWVLLVEVLGKNSVEITTGKQDGPLAGCGRVFRFVRTSAGWELDKKRLGGWLS